MAEQDPSFITAPLVFPRPVTGHRRLVQVSHPFCGHGNLLVTDASWSDAHQPNYVIYAFTPPYGPKQRTVHTAGSDEITWNLSGELTNSSIGLLGLMNSNARGVPFQSVLISQGNNDSYLFSNFNGYSLPWSNFSLSGSQNGAVTFTLEGRSTQPPFPGATGITATTPDVPIPSWFTGNDYVTSWSLSHSVNLTPQWVNTPSPYPAYYRPGHSEFTIQVTTMVALIEHSLIRFGIGGVSLVEATITSRNRTFGGRNAPVTYQVSTTNARVSDQNAFTPSVVIEIPVGPAAAGFG
jgi:hypothetical protein